MAADKNEHGQLSPSEIRKANKPLMEKKRRARINESLCELKSLVLDALKRDTSRYSKLEKADILEMTVKHLRSVQRRHMAVAMAADTTVITKYRSGFNECAAEVSRYLNSIDGLDACTKERLLCHLGNCTQKVNAAPLGGTLMATQLSAMPGMPSVASGMTTGGIYAATNAMAGYQMIPGTLPGGQVVLMPASASYQLGTMPAVPVYAPTASSEYSRSPSPASYQSNSSPERSNFSEPSNRAFAYLSDSYEPGLTCRSPPYRAPNPCRASPDDPKSVLCSPDSAQDLRLPGREVKLEATAHTLPEASRPEMQGRVQVKEESMWRPW